MTASKKSFSVTVFLRALIANMPASVHTLLMSAPVELGHNLSRRQGFVTTLRKVLVISSQQQPLLALPAFNRHSSVPHATQTHSKGSFYNFTGHTSGRMQDERTPSKQLKSDVALAIHCAGVDVEDLCARLQVRQTKLNFAVQTAWPQQRWIQCVRPVCGH